MTTDEQARTFLAHLDALIEEAATLALGSRADPWLIDVELALDTSRANLMMALEVSSCATERQETVRLTPEELSESLLKAKSILAVLKTTLTETKHLHLGPDSESVLLDVEISLRTARAKLMLAAKTAETQKGSE